MLLSVAGCKSPAESARAACLSGGMTDGSLAYQFCVLGEIKDMQRRYAPTPQTNAQQNANGDAGLPTSQLPPPRMIQPVLVPASGAGMEDDFCAGFSEGYKTIKGEYVMLPMCPMAPTTPMGSTPYREGIKAGILASRQGY